VIPTPLAVATQLEMQFANQVIENAWESLGLNQFDIVVAPNVDRGTILHYRKQENAPLPEGS
jgi:hypothetical protein